MTLDITEIIVILIGYGLGCFSTAYYLVRYRTGEDIRQLGSGNVGAKNVGRVLGAPGFIITFLGDFLKGALAVWLAFAFDLSPWGTVMTFVAVVAGHIWPAPLRFRGGKGIATAFGAVLVFDISLTFVLIGLFVLSWALLRRFVLSGLIVIAISPIVTMMMGRPQSSVIGVTVVVLLILIAHRKNVYDIIKQ